MTGLSKLTPLRGLFNCHAEGVHSIILRDRHDSERGMLRVFYAEKGALSLSRWTDDPVVMPHNHRQDIKLTGLFGDAENWTYEFGNGGTQYHEFKFGSALLNGSFSLEYVGTRRLFQLDKVRLGTVALSSAQVHTVVAEEKSAWLVEEGRLAEHATLCYSQQANKRIQTEGLYIPMSTAALNQLWANVLNRAYSSPQ